jgi:site-specific DNA recombinase
MSGSNSTPTRAVADFRMSTDRQQASIPEQREWARQAEAREGLRIVREFKDEGVAGDEIARRPDFLVMLEFCERQARAGDPVGAVLCWDADRFSRADSVRTAAVVARLMEAGVCRMLTAEGWVDFDDDVDRLLFNLKQDTAKRMYVKSLSGNVARSCLRRAREGRWCGGRRPYGYTLGADARLAVGDAAQAEAVRWAFRTYADRDVSLLLLAEQLNARGVPPPVHRSAASGAAGRWTRYNLHTILRNPIYTGDLHYNRTHMGKYRRFRGGQVAECKAVKTGGGRLRQCRNSGEDVVVVENAHPALIDRETFAAVQKKLAANRPALKKGTTRRRFDWHLSGLLRCGECGSLMWGVVARTDKNGRHYQWRKYVCGRYLQLGRRGCSFNHLHESDLLTRVVEVVRGHFSDPARLDRLRREIARQRQAQREDGAARVEPLRKQLADLAAKIDRGNDNLALLPADRIPGVVAKVREWEAQRGAVEAELKWLEKAADAVEAEDARLDAALDQLRRLPEVIGRAKPEQVREVVQSLVEKVELQFTHEDRGRRRSCTGWSGMLYLRESGAFFSKAGIELLMSLK